MAVDPSTGALLFNAWRDQRGNDVAGLEVQSGSTGTPVIRRKAKVGAESLWAIGAHSPAVSSKGQVAFARLLSPTMALAQGPPPSTVVVRSTIDGPDVTWVAEPARYQPLAWAGETLVVLREDEGSRGGGSAAQLLFLRDGQLVGEVSGLPMAISSDGRHILTSEGAQTPSATRPTLHVRDIASLSDVTTMSLDEIAATVDTPHFGLINNLGDWQGNTIALAGTPTIILSFNGSQLSLRGALPLRSDETQLLYPNAVILRDDNVRIRVMRTDLAALSTTSTSSAPPPGKPVPLKEIQQEQVAMSTVTVTCNLATMSCLPPVEGALPIIDYSRG